MTIKTERKRKRDTQFNEKRGFRAFKSEPGPSALASNGADSPSEAPERMHSEDGLSKNASQRLPDRYCPDCEEFSTDSEKCDICDGPVVDPTAKVERSMKALGDFYAGRDSPTWSGTRAIGEAPSEGAAASPVGKVCPRCYSKELPEGWHCSVCGNTGVAGIKPPEDPSVIRVNACVDCGEPGAALSVHYDNQEPVRKCVRCFIQAAMNSQCAICNKKPTEAIVRAIDKSGRQDSIGICMNCLRKHDSAGRN